MNSNINIELLKPFYVVAKYKNITKASEQLLISQSALSKSIKNLEEQLDCSLFSRSKKGVELTEEGEILFNSTEKIINILDCDLKKIVKSKTINILVGKVLAGKMLVPYLTQFRKMYPNVHINLNCTSTEGVLGKLRNHEVDLAVGYYIDGIDSDFEQSEILNGLHPIFVCNGSFSNLLNRPVSIKELENYPFIISAKGGTTHKYALDLFKTYNMDIVPTMEVLGTSLIEQFVKDGLGISILTEEFEKDMLNNKEIFKIDIKEDIPKRKLCVLVYKHREYSPEVDNLIKLLLNEKD